MARYLSLFLLLFSFGAQAAPTERIAVLELNNPAGLTKQEVNYLSELLRGQISDKLADQYLVIDKATMFTLLPKGMTPECIDEATCELEMGRMMQASYIITGSIIRFGKTLRVTVRLYHTQSGRRMGSEVASGREVTDMEVGIQEAGGRLLRRLGRGSRSPLRGDSKRRVIRGKRKIIGVSSSKRVIVSFTSDPEGAAVVIDGVQKCAEGKTGCKLELTEGAHQVSMTKTDYFIRSGTVNV